MGPGGGLGDRLGDRLDTGDKDEGEATAELGKLNDLKKEPVFAFNFRTNQLDGGLAGLGANTLGGWPVGEITC